MLKVDLYPRKCFFIKEQVRLKLFKVCFCLIVTLKNEKTSGGNGVYFRGLTCNGGLQFGFKDGGRVIVPGLLSSLDVWRVMCVKIQ